MKIKRYRNPLGHMISRDAMLHAWLPSFLSWQWREHLTAPLEIMARWCETQAASKLKQNAEMLKQYPSKSSESLNLWGTKAAQGWSARRDILLQTIQKLKDLP